MMHRPIKADVTALPRSVAVSTDETEWCILRTAAPRTLLLADSLAAAGFEVWTPREMQPVRIKLQDRNRRSPKPADRPEREAPIMPTFVFARGRDQDIADLAAILALPVSPHPPFSFFRYAGQIPTISGRSMTALREREERGRVRTRNRERHEHAVGSQVRVDDANFLGLTGKVERCDGRKATIAFVGMRIEVMAWKVLPDGVVGAIDRRLDRQRVTSPELVD